MYEEYIKQFITKQQEKDFSASEVLSRRLEAVSRVVYSELSLFISEWCGITGEHPDCWAIRRTPGFDSMSGGVTSEYLDLIYESFTPGEMLQFKIQVISGSVALYFPGESVVSFGDDAGLHLLVKMADSIRQWFKNHLYSGKLLDSKMRFDWRPEYVK